MYYLAIINYVVFAYYVSDLLNINCWHNFNRHLNLHGKSKQESIDVRQKVLKLRGFEQKVFISV